MTRLLRYQINPGVIIPPIPRRDDKPLPIFGDKPRQLPGPDSKLPKPVIPPPQKEPDGGRVVQIEKNAPEERKPAPARKPMDPPPRGVPPAMPGGGPRVVPAQPIPAPNNQPPGRGPAPAQPGAQQVGPNGWKQGKAIDLEGDDFLDPGKLRGLYDPRVGEFDQQDEATAAERGADKGTLAVLKGSDAQRAARTGPNGEAFTDDMLRAVDGWAQNIYRGRNQNPLEMKTAQELHKVYNAMKGIDSRLADPNLPPDQRKTLEQNLDGLRGTMKSYVHYAAHNFIVRPGYARYGQDGSLEFKNPQGGFSKLPQGQDAEWFADQKRLYGWKPGEQFVPRQPQLPKKPKFDGPAWQDDNGNPIGRNNPAKIAQDIIGQRKAALGDDGPVLGNNGRPIVGALPPVQMRPGDNGAGGGVRNMPPPKMDPRQRGGILPNLDADRAEAKLKLDIWEREQAKKRAANLPPGVKPADPNKPRDPVLLTPRQMQIIGAADMGGRMPEGVTPDEIKEARKARDNANRINRQPGLIRDRPMGDPAPVPAEQNQPQAKPKLPGPDNRLEDARGFFKGIEAGDVRWGKDAVGNPRLKWTDPQSGRELTLTPETVKNYLDQFPELRGKFKAPTNTAELNKLIEEQERRQELKKQVWSRTGTPMRFSQQAAQSMANGLSGATVSKGSMDVMTRYLQDLAQHDPDRLNKMLATNKVPERDNHYKWLDSLGDGTVDFLKYLSGGSPSVGGPATGSRLPPAIPKLAKAILTNPATYRRNLRDLHHELIEAGMYQPGTRPLWPDRERMMEVSGKLKAMGRHGELDEYLQSVQRGSPMVDLEEQASPTAAPPPTQEPEQDSSCPGCSGGLKEQVQRLQARGIKVRLPNEMPFQPPGDRMVPTIEPIRATERPQVPLIDDEPKHVPDIPVGYGL